MSLRSKIVLIVTLAVAVYTAGDFLLQRVTLMPRFAYIEREEAVRGLARAIEAIQSEVDLLDISCRDHATSDETYALVSEPDPDVRRRRAEANFSRTAMVQDELDLVYVCQADGTVLWSQVHDWRTGRELDLRDLPRERLSPNHPYLVDQNLPRGFETGSRRGFVSGLVQTEHGPMLLSARPVLPSDGEGEVVGTLIFGRLLSEDLMGELGTRNSVDVFVWSIDSPKLPAAERDILPRVTSSAQPVAEVRGEELLDVYTTLQDLRSAPSLLVRARVPREIWAQATLAGRYALLSTLSAGLLMLLVLLAVLQRMVLSPIGRLTAHAVRVGHTEDSSERLDLAEGREDEIGILAREFDDMLQKLALSRAAVVDTARRSGMSEIANGILHNVGNVLNSVNVSAGLVAERARSSSTQRLARLADLVEQHADDLGQFITADSRGKHVAPYLSELSRLMASEQEQMEREVTALNEGIDHIRQLVASHQAFAGRSGLREQVDLRAVLENALQISAQAAEEGGEVDVQWRLEELPLVRLDRHRLLEILVNLIKNAREAMCAAGGEQRLLLVTAHDPESGHVRIEVSDAGPGVESDSLTSVFQHGFTTKPTGHGFGLHSSANAAKELGGTLTVSSPGELGGATFVLELPLQADSAPQTALQTAAGGTA